MTTMMRSQASIVSLSTTVLLLIIFSLFSLSYAQNHKAICILKGTSGNQGVQGTIYFEYSTSSGRSINGYVSGLPPNQQFGIHIHEFGHVGTSDGTGTGGHYNPTGSPHGLPPDLPRHHGDMGNITSNSSGIAVLEKFNGTDLIWDMMGSSSIIGRGLIVHAQPDDGSQPVGNAGARIAQCTVGIANIANNNARNDFTGEFATCEVEPTTASGNVTGRITFQRVGDLVRVRGKLCGLPSNMHGFHVHTYGDMSNAENKGTSTGGHFNPENTFHGLPPKRPRHVGDMGNITATSGISHIDMTLDLLTFTGAHSIIGRGLIVHEKPDDGSDPVGNAGSRLGVCVIGVTNSLITLDDIHCAPVGAASSLTYSSVLIVLFSLICLIAAKLF